MRRLIVRGPGLRGPAGRDGISVPAEAATFVRFVEYSTAGQSRGAGGLVIWVWTGDDEDFVAPSNATGFDMVVGPASAPEEPDPEPEVIASDGFNRSDSLTIGSTPVGSKAWTKTGFVNTGILGNKLQVIGASGTSFTCVHLDAGVADQDVSLKVYATSDKLGPMVRYVDNDNHMRLIVYVGGGYAIDSLDGGVPTELVGFTGRSSVSGDTWRLRIVGTTYTAWHNADQIATGTVTTASPTATRCGITGAGAEFNGFADDFSVSSA